MTGKHSDQDRREGNRRSTDRRQTGSPDGFDGADRRKSDRRQEERRTDGE